MRKIHSNQQNYRLSHRLKSKRALNEICATAVHQQIERGEVDATHLRNRRRHLARQILKRIPHARGMNPRKLIHAAAMVLAMWGFSGIVASQQAEAVPLFQHTMLTGFDVGRYATPSFADIDNDGDLDAFVGEQNGTVKFYRNNGTAAAPIFAADAAGNPLAGFDVGRYATPSFADIDNDGDLDAFVGEQNGTVKFYRNNGTAAAPVFAADAVGNPLAGFDAGYFASPSFADIDNDGDLDAFVGESNGTVKFYRNNGTAAAPVFAADAVGNPLAGFDVGSRAKPSFADIDNDGDLDAFVGEPNGTVKFYRNNGTAAAPVFAADAVGNPLAGFDAGYFVSPSFADIDNDGDLDAFVGETGGTVKFYRNNGTAAAPVFAADAAGNPLAGFDVGNRAIPSFADIDNDGDLDAFVGGLNGRVIFYRNNGTAAAPVFAADAVGNPLAGFDVGSRATPSFADIDNDGDLDAFVGETGGTVKFYRNNGTAAAPVFAADAVGNPLAGFDAGYFATPSFADIDNDGDLDAFVGEYYGTIKFYRNNGTAAAPVFAADAVGNPLTGFDVGFYATPSFADIDNDGDLDAFVGEFGATVKFYRNNGTAAAPVFAADAVGNPLTGFDVGNNASPSFADIDNDGDLDAFVGESSGGIQFFENIEIQTLALPAGAGNLLISTRTAGSSISPGTLTASALVNPPAGIFSFGKISYNIITAPGATVVVRMVFPSTPPAGFALHKIDAANNYSIIPAIQYVQINATTFDLTLTDGGTFDLDGDPTNGIIVDPITVGAAATAAAAPIGSSGGCSIQPTGKFDPLLPLLALIATVSLWFRRKRR